MGKANAPPPPPPPPYFLNLKILHISLPYGYSSMIIIVVGGTIGKALIGRKALFLHSCVEELCRYMAITGVSGFRLPLPNSLSRTVIFMRDFKDGSRTNVGKS